MENGKWESVKVGGEYYHSSLWSEHKIIGENDTMIISIYSQ